ncbi:hypothetical protein B566_EDAN006705 [Ephemera danica]|nr:hypothetical protein B566_EDAN006705 [Ephemera danica]
MIDIITKPKMRVLQSVFFVVVIISSSLARPKIKEHETRDEYLDINGEQYYVVASVSLTPSDAATRCDELNMDLMDLQTPEKEQAVYNALVSHGYTRLFYWTSGQRLENQGWIWTNTGNPFTYFHWTINEPGPGLDFVYFDSFRYSWNGGYENSTFNFVCQERAAVF